ncbi:acid phosphatase/Vanadium-dependent haloperoxidase, partial [Periconia macrospinosa]
PSPPQTSLPEAKPPSKFRQRVFPGVCDKPTFKQFVKRNWLDIATQLMCTLAGFLIYRFGEPLMTRRFPVFPDMYRTPFGIRYGKPWRKEYIGTLASAGVSFGLPAVVMAALGLWMVRSFQDTHAAIMGLGYALSTTTLFQALLKWIVGGLRPYFLDVCAPRMVQPNATRPAELWKTVDVCTGSRKEVREAQMSFPSGHSAAAFAGFGFLALYMNAKFGIFAAPRQRHRGPNVAENSDVDEEESPAQQQQSRRAPHWQLGLFVTPLLLAFIIAASKIRDGWHHPEDVIRGALIGSAFAFMAFRMVYQS